MFKLPVSNDRINDVLYYETGFEQMHPYPHIMRWMEEQGYRYHEDWFCVRGPGRVYSLEFKDEKALVLFELKWR